MPTRSLSSLLAAGTTAVGLPAATKADAIRQLAASLAETSGVLDPDRLAADVAAREERMTTGVGEGLALPHARTPAVTGTVVALATLASPVEWGALDGEPVRVVWLLAGPEGDQAAHVHLLAQISRVIGSPGVYARIAAAQSADQLVAVVAEAERT